MDFESKQRFFGRRPRATRVGAPSPQEPRLPAIGEPSGASLSAGVSAASLIGRILVATLFAAYNLIPLYGLKALGWNAFTILLIYWAETVILAFWTMIRIRLLPVSLLGTIKVNGVTRAGTYRNMIGFFSLHAGGFILGHLVLLFALFSTGWSAATAGPDAGLGAMLALGIAFLGGGVATLTGPYRPAFVDRNARALGLTPPPPPPPPASGEAVGGVVGALYGRIVLMQVALIGGAWLAKRWGDAAPLTIIIIVKTVSDFFSRLRR